MTNVLLESSNLQLMYNLIHWGIGALLVSYGIMEYRSRNNKEILLPPLYFCLGSALISFLLLCGYASYYHGWYWPWQLNHEQSIHLTIGVAWILGGILTILARAKVVSRPLIYGVPVALAFGGFKFMIPHTHGADGIEYSLIYHFILGVALVLAAMVIAYSYNADEKRKFYSRIVLIFTILPGLIFFVYRHPASYLAECFNKGNTHKIDVSKPNQGEIKAELCDTIELYSTTDRNYAPALGEHTAHIHYPGFEVKTVNKSTSNMFTVSRSGTYKMHDHNSDTEIADLTFTKPSTSKDWQKIRY